MERALIAEALNQHRYPQLEAAKEVGAYLQDPQAVEKLREENKRREAQYRKQQEAHSIIGVAESLVTTHNTKPEDAIQTATDLFNLSKQFIAAWTE